MPFKENPMDIDAMQKAAIEAFKQQCDRIRQKYQTMPMTPDSFGCMEGEILAAGQAAMQAACKALLEAEDPTDSVVEKDGQMLRKKKLSPHSVICVFGPVTYQRGLYQHDSGGRTWSPVDAKAGLDHEYLTPLVKEGCLFLLASESPVAAEAILKKCANFQPSASCLYALIQSAGQLIEAHEDELYGAIHADESSPSGTRSLAVSMDGANVLLNEAGDKKGRPRERPGREEEPASAYRNAMVGTLTFYGDVPEDGVSPEKLSGRVVARMPEKGAVHFKARFEREVEAARAQVPAGTRLVMVCDGARGIWKYVAETELFQDFVQVVDYYHAVEHLSKAGEAIFGKCSPEGERWHARWRKRLLEKPDGVSSLLRNLDYCRERRRLGKAARKALATERGYFLRNKGLMKYAQMRTEGLPIGSGPVEAACKVVVKQRLCRSGQRWSRVGGQGILHLRTLVQSGRWELFWPRFQALTNAA
jgi:hypothetical protein